VTPHSDATFTTRIAFLSPTISFNYLIYSPEINVAAKLKNSYPPLGFETFLSSLSLALAFILIYVVLAFFTDLNLPFEANYRS